MLVFDIESNGLLDTISAVHCLVIEEFETGKTLRFSPSNIEEGIEFLQAALNRKETIVGHNIICFDIPALEKIYPNIFHVTRQQREYCLDTLVMSRLLYPEIAKMDIGLMTKGLLPPKLKGSHSLKAWGYRLKNNKGTYAEDEGETCWDSFNENMLDYCEQDVHLTCDVLRKLLKKVCPENVLKLEHDVQWLMFKQQENGFNFDIAKAEQLDNELNEELAILHYRLEEIAPKIPDKIFVPKRDNKRLGYKAGVPIQRYKKFNPNSRQQIEYIFREHFGYTPDNIDCFNIKKEDDVSDMSIEQIATKYHLAMTAETFAFIGADPKASEDIKKIAPVFEQYLVVNKLIGQLSTGKNAWLKLVNRQDSCIHGSVNAQGAVSRRATHSKPNIAQVPACDKYKGEECRELFTVPNGWLQVGVDACGLELRCLAHYLAPYDGGIYADTVVNGDIHTLNQQAAGLPTRALAKRFIYAFLYGAGDGKIGEITGGTAQDGKRIKQSFFKKTPAIKRLKDDIQNVLCEMYHGRVKRWKRRYLKALDGGHLTVRSPHSALNLLLQSCGAIICKYWIVETEKMLVEECCLNHGQDFRFMAWVHEQHCAR